MGPVLELIAVLLTGVMAGIYVGVALGDVRIGDLDGSQYAAMHQARDKTFGRVMPFVGLAVVSVLALNAFLAESSVDRCAFALACGAEVLDIFTAIRRQVPRNRMVQAWDVSAPPADWRLVRDGWAGSHLFRTALGLAIFATTAFALVAGA